MIVARLDRPVRIDETDDLPEFRSSPISNISGTPAALQTRMVGLSLTADIQARLQLKSHSTKLRSSPNNHIILPSKMPRVVKQTIPMRYTDSALLAEELDRRLGSGCWNCKVSEEAGVDIDIALTISDIR